MPLAEALTVLRTHLRVVLVTVCVGIVCAFVAAKLAGHQYAAASSVMIVAQTNGRDPSATPIDMPALLLSDTVLTRLEKRMHSDEPLKALRKRIDAQIDLQSSVMPIAYRDDSPARAIRGANVLAEELRRRYREISAQRYDDLSVYLGTALDRERAHIDDTSRKLGQLVARDPYLAQKNAEQMIGAEIAGLDQQRSSVSATAQAHALADSLAKRRLTEIQPLARNELLASDARYTALMQRFSKDSADADVVRAQFTQAYPGLPGLADQLARTKSVVERERARALQADTATSPTYAAAQKDAEQAQTASAADRAQLAALDAQMSNAQSHLANLPELGVQIAALRRDRDAAETAYSVLVEQRTITLAQQAEAAALSSVTIVDMATNAEPASGRGAALLPIATVFAFVVLAVALPFGLELTDTRLRRRATIEGLYGRPLIGRVPS
jgi:uncharacterized protein involved in exopolysaccharide biosynthesis